MDLKRILKHLSTGSLAVRKYFPPAVMAAIENYIRQCEQRHSGEVVFAIDRALDLSELLAGYSGRDKAIKVFSDLRVWDTEQNNGVLVYLLLADRDIEIVADRGINAVVPQEEWSRICSLIESSFKQGDFEGGMKKGLGEIADVLVRHFPRQADDRDELTNKPVVL